MYYKEEDKEGMVKDINYWIKKGMKIYSYYPVKGGWILNLNLASIPIKDYLALENGNKEEKTI